MITVAIAGILIGLALPSFNNLVANNNMTSNANLLVGALQQARMEAIKRNTHVVVKPTGTGWNSGFTVWVDSDRGNDLDASELIIRKVIPVQGKGVFTNSDSNIIFLSTGFIASAGTSNFTLCDNRSDEVGRTISILISGRVRNDEKPHPC